jgi:hypothetical protein
MIGANTVGSLKLGTICSLIVILPKSFGFGLELVLDGQKDLLLYNTLKI